MELSKTGYDGVMIMPAIRVQEYIDWKIKFDKDMAKRREEELEK